MTDSMRCSIRARIRAASAAERYTAAIQAADAAFAAATQPRTILWGMWRMQPGPAAITAACVVYADAIRAARLAYQRSGSADWI